MLLLIPSGPPCLCNQPMITPGYSGGLLHVFIFFFFKTCTTTHLQRQRQSAVRNAAAACVCFLPIHSGHKFVGRTSRGHTGFLIHLLFAVRTLIFLARRIWPFLSLRRRVCVFFPSILDIKFVGRTSRGHTGGRSHRIFNPPSFCEACLDFCREKDSAIPFPRRP